MSQKSPQKKKKNKKKEREREDVFDVLPERGREARVHAQGAPRLLLPRVCLFVCFFRRSLGETCGVVCCDLSLSRVLLDPKKIVLLAFFLVSNSLI